jgi:hypothetical protein
MYKRAGHELYGTMAACVEKHAERNKELLAYGQMKYGGK